MKLKKAFLAACLLAATATQSSAATVEYSFRFAGITGIISGLDDTIVGFQRASVRVLSTTLSNGLGGYDQDFGQGFQLQGGQLTADWAGLTDDRDGTMHNLSLGATSGQYFCFNHFFDTCANGRTGGVTGAVTYNLLVAPIPASGFLLPVAIAGMAAIGRRKKRRPSRG